MLALIKMRHFHMVRLLQIPATKSVSIPFLSCTHLKSSYGRSHTTTSPSKLELSDQQRQDILASIRNAESTNATMPWYKLAITYRIPVDTLKQILSDDIAETQKRLNLRPEITKAAASERFFNPNTGRTNWEKLAAEYDMPLVDCLRLFDKTLSTLKPRDLPPYHKWTLEEGSEFKQFISTYFKPPVTGMWSLAGIYFNTSHEVCFQAYMYFKKPHVTDDMAEDIKKQRESGVGWKAICAKYWMFASVFPLQASYKKAKNGLLNEQRGLTTTWTREESRKVRNILWKHRDKVEVGALSDLVAKEFLEKPAKDVYIMTNNNFSYMRRRVLSKDNMDRLRQLVEKYGEDWKLIDSEMGLFPGRAQHNWESSGKADTFSMAWSDEDIANMRYCIDQGMNDGEASRYIATKRPYQCTRMRRILAKQDNNSATALNRIKWSKEDDKKLMTLTVTTLKGSSIDWELISKKMGRTITSCRNRRFCIQHNMYGSGNDELSLEAAIADTVSEEVKKQIDSGPDSAVDWSRVSEVAGVSQLKCLEVNHCDDGKAEWVYDVETFSWDKAKKMTDFIEANYPEPVPVNFKAVSNYMWTRLSDCAQMYNLLSGKYIWTEEALKRAIQLRSEGRTFKEIAKIFSPAMKVYTVSHSIWRYQKRSIYQAPSAEERVRIEEAAEKYIGKQKVADIPRLVTKEVRMKTVTVADTVARYLNSHPYYIERMKSMDVTGLFDRISARKADLKGLAGKLDVPFLRLQKVYTKQVTKWGNSTRWTAEETAVLIDYVKSVTAGRPSWRYASQILVTRSPEQCRCRYYKLKSIGML